MVTSSSYRLNLLLSGVHDGLEGLDQGMVAGAVHLPVGPGGGASTWSEGVPDVVAHGLVERLVDLHRSQRCNCHSLLTHAVVETLRVVFLVIPSSVFNLFLMVLDFLVDGLLVGRIIELARSSLASEYLELLACVLFFLSHLHPQGRFSLVHRTSSKHLMKFILFLLKFMI